MAENAEHRQPGEDQSSGSWTSKLSKKLNIRSHGEGNNEKKAGKRAERAAPSSNPFARNYVPPEQLADARRSAGIDQPPPVTAPSNTVYNSPTAKEDKIGNTRQSSDNAAIEATGVGPSNQRSSASSNNQVVIDSSTKELDDDFIGLDMKGRPRRKSDLIKKPTTPEKASPPPNSSPNPFARASGTTPASRFFRRSLDRKSNDLQQNEPAGNTKTELLDTATGNTVRSTTAAEGSAHHENGNTALPIYSHFKYPETQTQESSAEDVAHALNNASALLHNKSTSNTDADVDDLGKKVNRLAFQSPEILSPASFVSADNYFEQKSDERCEDIKDQYHPSAQEILERAKFNSVDTTTHERMLPAVTHETIQRQVHEITQEHLTRDVHHYHHVHRILPVHEVEVLPAKHYRVVDGVQVEMDSEQIPQSRIDAWQSAIIPKIEA